MDLRLREKFGIGVNVGRRGGLVDDFNDGAGTGCGTGEDEEGRERVKGTLLKGVGHCVCADVAVAVEGSENRGSCTSIASRWEISIPLESSREFS